MTLATQGLSVRYSGAPAYALHPITFQVERAQTLAIVGPSGAGKTTLLRAIAGLVASHGSVQLGDRVFTTESPQARGIAMVFQQDALVPTMTLRENLQFAAAPGARLEDVARRFGIAGALDRRPLRVSGGERSRASLARAVLSGARALLLDEPFAHLDPPLRLEMLRWLRALRDEFSGPILYVTHDHTDALLAGDRLAILLAGTLADIGEPLRVYRRPASLAAARFFGERAMNVLDGAAFGRPDALAAFRPEAVRVDEAGWPARVLATQCTGSDRFLRVETPYGEVVMRVGVDATMADDMRVRVPIDAVAMYDRATGALLD